MRSIRSDGRGPRPDAITGPVLAPVMLPEGSRSYEENRWLRVRGKVGPGRKSVVATSVEPIEQPLDAYG